MKSSISKLYHALATIALALACVTVASAQSGEDLRMLLHDRSVTTADVVKWLRSSFRVEIVDSSSFFSLVTIRIDSASASEIRRNRWVLAYEPLPVLETNNNASRTAIRGASMGRGAAVVRHIPSRKPNREY